MSPRERISRWLEDNEAETAWFARPSNFAWLVGGDNRVSTAADVGVAAAGYDGEAITVVTNNIEADRLREEELPGGTRVETFQWHESSLAEAVANASTGPAAADFDVPGLDRLDASGLRQPLPEAGIERYRSLSTDAAEAVESVARDLDPGTSEREAAARLQRALTERGITTPVVLVGSGERGRAYRHYTVQDEPLGSHALLSVTATRDGLYTSLTRTVAFDPPEWLEERTSAAMRVEATAIAATRAVGSAGGTADDVFAAIQDAYEAVGYPGEWQYHHQGGAAGYAGREWKATPGSDAPVRLPTGYAWNPTVQGAKSEDTVLVREDGAEVLSATGEWPSRTVEAVEYDLAIERHGILHR
jgi:Xaa-Pro aminopeptidase